MHLLSMTMAALFCSQIICQKWGHVCCRGPCGEDRNWGRKEGRERERKRKGEREGERETESTQTRMSELKASNHHNTLQRIKIVISYHHFQCIHYVEPTHYHIHIHLYPLLIVTHPCAWQFLTFNLKKAQQTTLHIPISGFTQYYTCIHNNKRVLYPLGIIYMRIPQFTTL